MIQILVVEDDLSLSAGLCFELDAAGYSSIAAYNCAKARFILESSHIQLVLLDVNLPDGTGHDLCREIKAAHPTLPVIFLTAKDLEEDMLTGFDMGADDYVTKPFSNQVVLRRIEAVLRRTTQGSPTATDVYDDGFLRLDLESLEAVRGSEKLPITPNEYKILRALIANAGNIVTRGALLEKIWDSEGNYIDDHTLTVNVNRLRAKLEDADHTYIKTIRGMGYIWAGKKQ